MTFNQLSTYINLHEHIFEIHLTRINCTHMRHAAQIQPMHMSFCHSAIVVVRDARAYIFESIQGVHEMRMNMYNVDHAPAILRDRWTEKGQDLLYWIGPLNGINSFDLVIELTPRCNTHQKKRRVVHHIPHTRVLECPVIE